MTPHGLRYTTVASPIGPLTLTSDGEALTGVYMEPQPDAAERWVRDDRMFKPVVDQLNAYFEGDRQQFDIPLSVRGTPFQERVWKELRAIPYGETISYAQLAQRVGLPRAARAVGSANGCNRIPIIIPCHRVIASGGGLGGFGGGLDRKRWLLEHESTIRARSSGSITAGRLFERVGR
jgi:methylated-DNA-[protein]-cysteine S-methyltransferase